MKTNFLARMILLALTAALISCYVSPDPHVRRGRRTGAVVGGISGAVIGNNVSGMNSWGGAAVGAALGGIMGDMAGKRNSMYYRGGYYYR